MLSPSGRALFTLMIWVLLIGAMISMSAILSGTLGYAIISIPIILTVAGITVSGFIWNWGQLPRESQDTAESLKRNRLTMALRDLSDDELKGLRQRLSNGDVDDDQLARLLDESEASKAKNRG